MTVRGLAKPRLVLVLGDQLTPGVAALRLADKERDVVVMVEAMAAATHVPHHPKKTALVLAAMRTSAAAPKADGGRVACTRLDDAANTGLVPGDLVRRAAELGADEVIAPTPGRMAVDRGAGRPARPARWR